jgi:hypothetical protein
VKVVLLSIIVLLSLVLVLQWRDWPPARTSVPEASTDQPAEPVAPPSMESPLELLAPPEEKDDYAVVVERPLFLPDRRPPAEEPEDVPEDLPVEEDPAIDALDLNAVIITPTKVVAWVRDPSKKDLQDLELGDDLNGWTVKEILADRLVLERQGETNTLTLRDYENMPPPAAPRPPPAARAPAQGRRAPGRRPPDTMKQPNAPQARQVPDPRTRRNAQPNR